MSTLLLNALQTSQCSLEATCHSMVRFNAMWKTHSAFQWILVCHENSLDFPMLARVSNRLPTAH